MQGHTSAEREPPAPLSGRRNLLQAEHTGVKRNARIDVRYVKRDVVDRDRRTVLSAQNGGESEEKRDDCAEAAEWNGAFEAFCRHQNTAVIPRFSATQAEASQEIVEARVGVERLVLRMHLEIDQIVVPLRIGF